MTQSPTLVLLAEEQLTVSSSAQTITSTLFDDSQTVGVDGVVAQTLNVYKAVMSHVSGGKIYHHEKWGSRTIKRQDGKIKIAALSSVSNTGANGELPQSLGDKWEIIGREALGVWEAIKASGTSDATVNVALYGKAD